MNKKNIAKRAAVILLCAFMLAAPFVVLGNLPRSDLFVAGARFEGHTGIVAYRKLRGRSWQQSGMAKKTQHGF